MTIGCRSCRCGTTLARRWLWSVAVSGATSSATASSSSALERLLEIVGEPANRVSREAQARFPDIPWREAIGMRHRVSHGYDVVSHDTLWDTVLTDFPKLIEAVESALRALESTGG